MSATLLGFALALFSTAGSSAQNSNNAHVAEPPILNWWETVGLEHRDRKERLDRLAHESQIAPPQFFEYLIPKADLPGFPVAMPVLRVVFQERVFFDTASWDLTPESEAVLATVAESLRREPPDVALFVAGHTDNRGSDAYNLDLSIKRATTVAKALLKRGIGLAAVWRVGFGKSVPLRPNNSEPNMAMNRRVEFLFASKPAAVAVWLAHQSEAICGRALESPNIDCRDLMENGRFTAVPVTAASLKTEEQNTNKTVLHETKLEAPPPTRTEGRQTQPSLVEIRKIQPIEINLTTKTIEVGRPLL